MSQQTGKSLPSDNISEQDYISQSDCVIGCFPKMKKSYKVSSKRSAPFSSNIAIVRASPSTQREENKPQSSGSSRSVTRMEPARPVENIEPHPSIQPAKKVPEDMEPHPSIQPANGSEKTDARAKPVLKTRESVSSKDVMISYSHADKEIMLKLRENLEKYGLSVWVDVSGLTAGQDFFTKIGEAVIDCKLFISLLSKSTVQSRFCQDEVALAYVSNRAIFPVALDEPNELYPIMSTGMKLQLASYEWTILGWDANAFDDKFATLLKKLKAEILRQEEGATGTEKKAPSPDGKQARPGLQRQGTRYVLNKKNLLSDSGTMNKQETVAPDVYWQELFGQAQEVSWKRFVECFQRDFKKQLDKLLNNEEQEWLMNILKREMEAEEDVLFKYELLAFCNIDGEYQPLWRRVNEQARESWAMREVFDMNSSVRVDAIENLGKFRSAAVIDALRDLLVDEDANCRAVAAVSLARTEAKDPVTVKSLMKTLNDKDRLVREAGCLALGHLQVKQAVSKLLHMWRNDVISHVREAANVALNQIGGPEVEKAMRVTKVLAEEIRQLTNS